jgi:hypothetical protein
MTLRRGFRFRLVDRHSCDAFRRAIDAHSVPQFLVQILEWLRDEFRRMKPATR